MVFEIIFLGSGGSIPVEGRNHPAIIVRYEGWNFLLDAGEDVQRQYEKAGIGLNKRLAVFISHRHPDHILGLPGLLLRFSLLGRTRPLKIYGPPELLEWVKLSQESINLSTAFEATVYGVTAGEIFGVEDVSVSAFEVDHRGPAYGYSIVHQRPTGPFLPEIAKELGVPKGPLWSKLASGEEVQVDGRVVRPEEVTGPRQGPTKIVYSGDTRPCQSLKMTAVDADVLIHEAMYTQEHAELANERGHSTAADAATIAKECGVGLLVLTHYSPRYYDGSTIIEEAQEIFPQTVLAKDMMQIGIETNGTPIVTSLFDK